MKMNVLIALAIVLVSCRPGADRSNADFRAILYYADNRAPADSLYPYLHHDEASIRLRAVKALGQMQDTAATDTVLNMLQEADPDMRSEAALALGQISYGTPSRSAQDRIEAGLTARFHEESLPKVRRVLTEALGKTSHGQGLDALAEALQDPSEPMLWQACLAVARSALRGAVRNGVTARLVPLLRHHNADIRWTAVYALMRVHDRNYASDVAPLLKDPDERVRWEAARALGLMGLDEADAPMKTGIQNALLELATSDPDWRVRTSAVGALGSFKFKLDDLKKTYFLIAFEGLRDKNEHVRISAIRAMARSYRGDVPDAAGFLAPFADRFIPAAGVREQGEIITALAGMFGEKAWTHPATGALWRGMLNAQDRTLRAAAVAALGSMHAVTTLPELEIALRDSFLLVANNAADALNTIGGPKAEQLLINALDTGDPVLLSIAAGYLGGMQDLRKNKARAEAVTAGILKAPALAHPMDADIKSSLCDALGDLGSPRCVDFLKSLLTDSIPAVAAAAARNLNKVTGQNLTTASGPRRFHAIDFESVLKIKKRKPTAIIATARGTIEMEFYVDDAPLTVANFVRLAERSYFNGQVFHRVVPNFVIQTGDPTGTGWGGPGYAIRSEFSSRTYDRGTVGMASAGRDTEGSQWFITHSPQPHLDGRYTVFARVTKGMEVVDEIQVGDRIDSVAMRWY